MRPTNKFILVHWLNARLYFVKNLRASRGSVSGNQPNSTRNSKEQSCPYSCANNRNPSVISSHQWTRPHQAWLKKMEFKLLNNLLAVNRKKIKSSYWGCCFHQPWHQNGCSVWKESSKIHYFFEFWTSFRTEAVEDRDVIFNQIQGSTVKCPLPMNI